MQLLLEENYHFTQILLNLHPSRQIDRQRPKESTVPTVPAAAEVTVVVGWPTVSVTCSNKNATPCFLNRLEHNKSFGPSIIHKKIPPRNCPGSVWQCDPSPFEAVDYGPDWLDVAMVRTKGLEGSQTTVLATTDGDAASHSWRFCAIFCFQCWIAACSLIEIHTPWKQMHLKPFKTHKILPARGHAKTTMLVMLKNWSHVPSVMQSM